jgi:putative membrane protein
MKKASNYFSDENKKLIEEAIERAESYTRGEIVPVVASVSGRYDRSEDIFGVIFSLILLTIAWLTTQEVIPISGQWETEVTTFITLPWAVGIIFLGFIMGAILASFFSALRLIFISKKEMQEAVHRKAQEAFHHFRIRGTQGAKGVLINVSLYEHSVRVLGDEAISEKLTQQDWEVVCNLVVEGMKSKQPVDKLVEAIELCGQLLAQHFPIEEGDQNELPNKLQLLD